MPVAPARAIAEQAHRNQMEPSGRPYIAHVRRVASAVPPFARSVAWLHDTLEWTAIGERDLVTAGLAPEEIAALRL
jgi:(p)ppGpp synthase/HD superfamily hydrolase